jgi:S-adenosyl-L-methionine hydrolase (adenosine-forming)
MAIITFMSDFGTTDYYTAAVKGKLLSIDASLNIVDVSHTIEQYNIAHGSFVLKYIYTHFPAGTTHLVSVNAIDATHFIALNLDDHYFVGPDNGLFSLISNKTPQDIVFLKNEATSKFPTLDILAPAAASLSQGDKITSLGEKKEDYYRLLPRQVKANKKQISGHVIRVNNYGNLITNIEKQEFDILSKDKIYNIVLGRERIRKINSSPTHAEPGDCFVIFNDLGLLEIGINKGNASELLGLKYDSSVHIIFKE